MNNDTLDLTPLTEKQREELRKRYTEMIENSLFISNIEVALSVTAKHIFVTAKNLIEVQEVLSKLPACDETYTMGDTRSTTLNRPYRISIKNPAAPNQYNNFMVNISYRSYVPWIGKHYEVSISIPVIHLIGFLEVTSRKVTDLEYHYFIGVSMKQLLNMHVKAYTFKDGKLMRFYGGDIVLSDEREIDRIMAFIQDWKEVPNE